MNRRVRLRFLMGSTALFLAMIALFLRVGDARGREPVAISSIELPTPLGRLISYRALPEIQSGEVCISPEGSPIRYERKRKREERDS
ncbi:MAG: hypothetical protein HY315_03010 [Acidobacteria bacterium]|nr:hypothetical protein [Acidobacteriota bacterium]